MKRFWIFIASRDKNSGIRKLITGFLFFKNIIYLQIISFENSNMKEYIISNVHKYILNKMTNKKIN